jgi:hypothetical protein
MPEFVVVTRPPTQTSGKVAQANSQAQRWGQGEGRDGLSGVTVEGWGVRDFCVRAMINTV